MDWPWDEKWTLALVKAFVFAAFSNKKQKYYCFQIRHLFRSGQGLFEKLFCVPQLAFNVYLNVTSCGPDTNFNGDRYIEPKLDDRINKNHMIKYLVP